MKKVSLNGIWKFTKDQITQETFMTADWSEVTVPHTWNGIDGQDGGNDYYRGLCWYQKTIEIVPHDGRVFLEFEGVNSIATVTINGQIVGTHKGGYSTFRFDVTNHVKIGMNLLAVGVDNRHYEDVYPLMADFTFYGGIYRDSYIVYTNNVSFDLEHVGAPGVYVSQTDINDDVAHFVVDAFVSNHSEKVDVVVSTSLLDHDNQVVLEQSEIVAIDQENHVKCKMELHNPHLWNGVEDPYLYTVQVQLILNDKVIDERSIPTGFRYFHFDDEAFYLNGNKLRLRGVSRHQDRWEVGNALTNEMHDEDMALIKEIGANTIRLAHYQQAQYFYDLCDKEGMIIWAEIPYISVSSKTDETGENAIRQMEELVKQNYNHSSIVMWGVQNEITIQGKVRNLENIVQNLHDLTKEWDPYRLTTQAHVAMHPLEDSMHDITDVIAYNNYFGWYMGEAEDFGPWLDEWRRLHPDKPIGMSEYGAEGIIKYHSDEPAMKDYTEEYHALWHEKVYSIFESKEYVWGTYVWNMFAFAADARDEGGVKGLNNKGLVTIDRKIKKDAFYYYKAKWNTQEDVLHLCSKRFVDRHNVDIELKVYSNLEEVHISVNGKKVDNIVKNDVVFTAKVTLEKGRNTVIVKSKNLIDSTIFETVNEPNPEYSVPQHEQGKSILGFEDAGNWFDDIKDTEEEMTFHPEFFSVADPISDIIESKEGLALFEKYMVGFMEHPMFEMAKGFNLKMISDFDKKAMPDKLLKIINIELQKIKK